MAITTQLVGKLGGGASWTTVTIPPKTASGQYVYTEIYTLPTPSTGKALVGFYDCTYVKNGGYPSTANVQMTNQAGSKDNIYGATSNSGDQWSGGVFRSKIANGLRVYTSSATGSVTVSGTVSYMEIDAV